MKRFHLGLPVALIAAGLLAGCVTTTSVPAPSTTTTTSKPTQTVVHITPVSLQRFLSIPDSSVLVTGFSITKAPATAVVLLTKLQAQAAYYNQFPSRVAPRILGIFLVRATHVRPAAQYPPPPNPILCWAVVISAKVEHTFQNVASLPRGKPWTAILLSAISGSPVTGFTGTSQVH